MFSDENVVMKSKEKDKIFGNLEIYLEKHLFIKEQLIKEK